MVLPVTVTASRDIFRLFKIGKAAEIVGYSVESIRHYETIGLLRVMDRSESGQRLYNQEDIDLLKFIKAFRKIGVSLKDITQAVKALNSDAFCFQIEEMREKYMQVLEQKRKELRDCDEALEAIKKTCENCSNKKPFNKKTCTVMSKSEI